LLAFASSPSPPLFGAAPLIQAKAETLERSAWRSKGWTKFDKQSAIPYTARPKEHDAVDIEEAFFKVDLRDLPYTFWKLLGEARSKCEHQ
jgi:hypothetical protein